MLPDRVSNPGPLTYESGALPIALRGPAYGDVRLIIPKRSLVLVPDNNPIRSLEISNFQ